MEQPLVLISLMESKGIRDSNTLKSKCIHDFERKIMISVSPRLGSGQVTTNLFVAN